MKNKNRFLILIGKSASGKTSIAEQLCTNFGYKQYKTATTRPKRKNENKDAYYFWSKKKFERKIKRGDFIEIKSYRTILYGRLDTWYYGTPKMKTHFWDRWKSPQTYVIVLTPKGAEEFVNYYGRENCNVYYIVAENNKRYLRAKERGTFSEDEWQRRYLADMKDFSTVNDTLHKTELIDYVIHNDDKIESAIGSILGIDLGDFNEIQSLYKW